MQVEYTGMTGPSFRFRLERVRALRERREDAAKQALAGALQEHHRREQEVRAAEDRMARAREAKLDAAAADTTASDLLAHQAYLERTEQAHVATQNNLDRHAAEVQQRREALSEAAKERQALERLKEQRRADHEREAARREGTVLDEIAINGFRRKAA